MAASSSSSQVLALYRTMLKESKKFSGYNYRTKEGVEQYMALKAWKMKGTFALRRIRDAFRENKNETNAEVIQGLIEKAKTNTEIIRRQGCGRNWSTHRKCTRLKDDLAYSLQTELDTTGAMYKLVMGKLDWRKERSIGEHVL
ncbi:LYR motif-containing protein 4-like isoform X2 [Narcine bancroftii]|uniref:LYR motif-containing protein 4-like isoform X2 n=1 Tax=Narcine bancroftii TaxID=1343680 RepID=UPI003831B0FF